MFNDWYLDALRENEIRYILLGDHMRRARKKHKCSHCQRTIKIGDTYRNRFYLGDVDQFGRGEPGTEKTCKTCLDREYGFE